MRRWEGGNFVVQRAKAGTWRGRSTYQSQRSSSDSISSRNCRTTIWGSDNNSGCIRCACRQHSEVRRETNVPQCSHYRMADCTIESTNKRQSRLARRHCTCGSYRCIAVRLVIPTQWHRSTSLMKQKLYMYDQAAAYWTCHVK